MFNIMLLLLPLFGSVTTDSYPEILSAEEEAKYLKLWEQHDEKAREILIEHNLRLVAHIVKKFDNMKEEKDDLLSIGAFGLIKAVDSYNFNSNTRLATYASRCIENEILMYIRSNKRKRQTVWLYQPIGTDKEGNEIHLCDIIEDPSPSVIENLMKSENIKIIQDALSILDEREYDIIACRYGFDRPVETQRQIAKRLNISRSYVSRIEKRALTKLYLHIQNLKEKPY